MAALLHKIRVLVDAEFRIGQQNVIFLSQTDAAGSGSTAIWGALFHYVPFDVRAKSLRLLLPNILGQAGGIFALLLLQ